MILDPRTLDFWRSEELTQWEMYAPLIMRALLAGANGGALTLPIELQGLIDWDLFNRAALDFLHRYRVNTIADISNATRDSIVRAIDEWVQSGEHLDVLRARLQSFALSAKRADAIAVTEVTRIFAQGNMQLWNSTGVVGGKQWMTAVDERVCPICRPLHGQIVELTGDFQLELESVATSPAMRLLIGSEDMERARQRAASLIRGIGASHLAPPAHVRCRCWLQPVVSSELLREQVGGILAGQFFARVLRDRLAVVIA